MIVLNKIMNEVTSEFLVQMFKPSWSPTAPAVYETHGPASQNSKIKNIVPPAMATALEKRTEYTPFDTFVYTGQTASILSGEGPWNNNNYIFPVALVGESFLQVMEQINNMIRTGLIPEVVFDKTEAFNSNTGVYTVTNIPNADMYGLTVGTDNRMHIRMKSFETSTKSLPLLNSQSVPELIMRLFYSLEDNNRNKIKYKHNLAKDYLISLGIDVSLLNSALNCFFPIVNFDTTQIETEYTTDGSLLIKYNKPMKLSSKYVQSVNNPGTNPQKLYLFFPFINSALTTTHYPTLYLSNADEAIPTNITANPASVLHTTGDSVTIDNNNKAVLVRKDMYPTLTDKFYSEVEKRYIITVPYSAIEIGEVGSGADIEFDHIDRIDHIDGFTIGIQSPYVIS